jgi:hypothetical protein
MQCGQGKPFKSYKMGGEVKIPSYKKGGEVKMPSDIDSISAESPAERARYEKMYGLAPAGAEPSKFRKPPAVVTSKVRVAPKKQ